jgi:hypothetical protein
MRENCFAVLNERQLLGGLFRTWLFFLSELMVEAQVLCAGIPRAGIVDFFGSPFEVEVANLVEPQASRSPLCPGQSCSAACSA